MISEQLTRNIGILILMCLSIIMPRFIKWYKKDVEKESDL